jgi:hypothetical protein
MAFSLKTGVVSKVAAENGGRFSTKAAPQLIEKNYPISPPHQDVFLKRFVFNESETSVDLAISLSIPATTSNAIAFLAEATQRDFQSDLSPSRYYTIGLLSGAVLIDATTLIVEFPLGSADFDVVMAGDKLLLQSPVSDNAHTTETHEIVEVDSVVWTDDSAEITLVTGIEFAWDDQSTVSSCVICNDVVSKVDNVVQTNCSISSGLIELTYQATIEQTLTFTFTNSTDFTVISDVLGTMPTGDIASLYAPNNPATGTPYLSILPEVWVSTTTGATLVLQTHSSAAPVWTLVRAYPAAAASYAHLADLAIKSL